MVPAISSGETLYLPHDMLYNTWRSRFRMGEISSTATMGGYWSFMIFWGHLESNELLEGDIILSE